MPLDSVLIVGSGVFGLSTAYALTQRPFYASTKITLLDRSPFPSPDGSSIDSSRIVRADYSDPAYASLAAAAQEIWRDQSASGLGGEGRYTEAGLVLVANQGVQGEEYIRNSFENVRVMVEAVGDRDAVRQLGGRGEIEKCVGTGGGSGDVGYVNWRSGWADAEGGMRWLRRQVEGTERVEFLCEQVQKLVREGKRVVGVKVQGGKVLKADLVILATGAWTGSLVNLQGRATATGQVLMYLSLTAAEQERLGKMPVLLNMSSGLFIIPPANRILKVARHAYGYSNPTTIPNPDSPSGPTITISLPLTTYTSRHLTVPLEGERACRAALREMIPELGNRPFEKGRICWYADTPKGDFLITYHPEWEGLFLATGGSGHGYKFLPVIGERVVDCLEGNCPVEFREKWRWPETVEVDGEVITEDGSRGGKRGLVLEVEMGKGSKL